MVAHHAIHKLIVSPIALVVALQVFLLLVRIRVFPATTATLHLGPNGRRNVDKLVPALGPSRVRHHLIVVAAAPRQRIHSLLAVALKVIHFVAAGLEGGLGSD